jgi:FMN-dependent NADH-azoreductase
MKLLHVDSSILGDNSVSRSLSAAVVTKERQNHPGIDVIYRDLAAQPLQHLSGAHLAAAQASDIAPPADLLKDLQAGQSALDDFLAADVVVIGTPMYNFGIPSQLKAWIDRIAVAGKTFRYGANGVEGLCGGKRLIIASARGGIYAPNTPMGALDHQENYLRGIFGFLGITDLTIIHAEGVAMTAHREAAIASAKEQIAQLV